MVIKVLKDFKDYKVLKEKQGPKVLMEFHLQKNILNNWQNMWLKKKYSNLHKMKQKISLFLIMMHFQNKYITLLEEAIVIQRENNTSKNAKPMKSKYVCLIKLKYVVLNNLVQKLSMIWYVASTVKRLLNFKLKNGMQILELVGQIFYRSLTKDKNKPKPNMEFPI